MLYIMIFFSGLISLLSVRNHYLLSLLSLEFVLISVYFFMLFYFSFFLFDFGFCMFFLVLGVCDSVIGLSLLVYLVRKTGNDYLMSLSLC